MCWQSTCIRIEYTHNDFKRQLYILAAIQDDDVLNLFTIFDFVTVISPTGKTTANDYLAIFNTLLMILSYIYMCEREKIFLPYPDATIRPKYIEIFLSDRSNFRGVSCMLCLVSASSPRTRIAVKPGTFFKDRNITMLKSEEIKIIFFFFSSHLDALRDWIEN